MLANTHCGHYYNHKSSNIYIGSKVRHNTNFATVHSQVTVGGCLVETSFIHEHVKVIK